MRGRVVPGSSPGSPALHRKLRKLDRQIAKDIWRIKIELILEPKMAKLRMEKAKQRDDERRRIRHELKDRRKPSG